MQQRRLTGARFSYQGHKLTRPLRKFPPPFVGVSRAASKCNSVVLPEPDSPTRATNSPACTSTLSSLRTTTSSLPERKDFDKSWARSRAAFGDSVIGLSEHRHS